MYNNRHQNNIYENYKNTLIKTNVSYKGRKISNPSYNLSLIRTNFHICLTGKTLRLHKYRIVCQNHENWVAILIQEGKSSRNSKKSSRSIFNQESFWRRW